MPDRTACAHCQRIGFVRVEHTITAGAAVLDFYCGACNRSWSIPDSDTPPDPRAHPADADKPEP